MKYVVVSGGTVSGLGKGITISSIGVVLKSCGLNVTSIKIDPYLNCDAGTMSPFEHGEVFVLNDGGEGDLDLGNYERFLNITLTKDHNITTGKVYKEVIYRERKGDYLGKTVQVVPHITDAIQEWIERVAHLPIEHTDSINKGKKIVADICLIEVGGTVGDIESMVFLEALRQFRYRIGEDNFALLHVSLVPILGSVGEQKTKPAQHAVRELRSAGLIPDIIICRSITELEKNTKIKIGSFCHLPPTHVLSVHDVTNIYHVPLLLSEQKISELLMNKFKINRLAHQPNLNKWSNMAHSIDNFTETVKIAVVGKYTGLQDSYLSIIKSLKHASMKCNQNLEIVWIESGDLENTNNNEINDKYTQEWNKLKNVHGVVVPGGFGDRGVDGKVATSKFCRDHKIPYLGICLGMQVVIIDFARNVLNLKNANSEEFDKNTNDKVIIFMPEINQNQMGGTMRLGARETLVKERLNNAKLTLAHSLYNCTKDNHIIIERHRHRYEVNTKYKNDLKNAGLYFTGTDIEGERMEIVELDQSIHPFFFATQYHPEFKSHPDAPSPPFYGLVLAATNKLKNYLELKNKNVE